LAALVEPAVAEAPPAPAGDDVAYVQFAAVCELVQIGFATQLEASHLAGSAGIAKRILDADGKHWTQLAAVLAADAPAPDDYVIRFPKGTFRTPHRALLAGETVEALQEAVLLQAMSDVADSPTRALLAQILSADATHRAALHAERTLRGVFGHALPAPRSLESAGNMLDAYLA
jgi:hypothetical protein